MSMTLKRVELWNIRSHKNFRFEPDEKGITSVSGVNGAGKSTILDSFAWALYGTKPNNIKNKMLIKDGVSTKNEEVKVEVEIEVNKMSYLINRSIISDSGASECNVYGRVTSDNEYSHLAGPAISSAESFIRQVLKMDEKGFLTAIFIQQKQVDQIVAASPRERGEVIEKLTGIQSITNAISLAKEEVRAGQKAASLITTKDVDSIKKEIETAIVSGKALRAKTENDRNTIDKLKESIEEYEVKYALESKKTERKSELKRAIEFNKHTKGILQKDLDEQTELVSNFKNDTGSVVAPNLNELLNNSREKSRELLSLENKINEIKQSIELKEAQVNKVEELNIDSDVESKISELKESESSKNLEFDELKNKKGRLKGQILQIKKSLDTIDLTERKCPVCKTQLDSPEELKKELEEEIGSINEQISEVNLSGRKIVNELGELGKGIEKLESNLKLLERAKEVKSELVGLKESLPALELEKTTVSAEAKVLNEIYSKELEISVRADEIKRAKEKIKRLNSELTEVKNTINSLEEEMNSFESMTTKELNKVFLVEIEKRKKEYNNLLVENSRELSELDFARKLVAEKKEHYKEAKEANDKYEALVNSMKTSNVASGLMSEFKSNRLKYSIPALEMYASTILSKFTENKFTKLSLDGKFNTTVTTESGVVRSISQLSGGELSAAAIALRIGVSMLLNDGDNNVLILDEILVSMDEVRARLIIETITSITNCQIIFIAHNADIKSIADKTVLVQ